MAMSSFFKIFFYVSWIDNEKRAFVIIIEISCLQFHVTTGQVECWRHYDIRGLRTPAEDHEDVSSQCHTVNNTGNV